MSNGSKRVARAKLAREHKRINIVNSMTLEECFEKYIDAKKSEGVTERTLYNKQINFNIVFNYLLSKYDLVYPTDLSSEMMREAVNYMRFEHRKFENNLEKKDEYKTIGLAIATINSIVGHWKAFYNYLYDEEFIPSNPLKNIKLMKNTTQVEGLAMDELKLLLGGFNQDTYAGYRGYLLTLLLADTGMRCGEAINLKWNQIDFKHDVVTLNASETKSGKMRFVPFSKKTNRLLREWKQEVAEVSEYYVFPSIYGDKPYRQREYRNLLNQLSKEVGIKHVHPHMIRHTFATQYLVHGGDALSLQKILGHSSLEMVRIYVDMSQKDITYKQNKFSPINFL